ncbi:LysM and putative peptidoglycan-binding domain-containing protein 1 [Nymphon striatum]|nr:LysM and putative peptidoglycan-binding domain-containing protein 1 [Nymphon striatum]
MSNANECCQLKAWHLGEELNKMRIENMDERKGRSGDETSRLGNYVHSKTKYGSTSRNISRPQKFIKHHVSPSDTLPGLSLKYGVSMEDIKRINKIWTNDSIFLRSSLDIPVPNNSTNELCSDTNGHLSDQSTESEASPAPELSLSDIFGRIDSTIAQSKDRVKSLQETTTCSTLDLHSSCSPGSSRSTTHRHGKYRNANYSSSSQEDEYDLYTTAQPIVMTKGQKVKSSLKKLRQQHDDIFEL